MITGFEDLDEVLEEVNNILPDNDLDKLIMNGKEYDLKE